MSDPTDGKSASPPGEVTPKPSRRRLLVITGLVLLLFAGGAAGALFMVPGAKDAVMAMMPGGARPAPPPAPTGPVAAAPGTYIELPEMTLTLPNGGRARQLRIKLAVELAQTPDPERGRPEVLGPRVSDALVMYLRTLRDSEVEGAIAMDRIRGDLLRRLDLLLGAGVVRDVLITGLVVA